MAQEIKIDGIKPVHQHIAEEVELSMDIFEADDIIFLIIPMAGVNIENVKIHLSEDVLTIEGKRDMPESISHFHSKRFFIEECHWGKFSRSIVLPEVAHSADIKASTDNGILTITIPKAKKVKEKDILIHQTRI